MWITSIDAQSLLGISRQAIDKRCNSGKLQSRISTVSGHVVKEIALESLPAEAQARYWEQVRIAEQVAAAKRGGRPSKAQQKAKAEAEARAAAEVQANQVYLEAPDWQKQRVDERLGLLHATAGMGRSELAEYLRCHQIAASVNTVYRWRRMYADGGKNALMTAYGNRAGQSVIPDDVFSVFVGIYNTEGKCSIKAAYLTARGYYTEHYTGKCPSAASFEYRLKRDISEQHRYMARYGASAYNRKYGYSIPRDLSALRSGECAVGDHMQLDLQVTMPDGKIVRPWLTAWVDMKSRRFLGWDLHAEAPNSDHIFKAFYDMAKRFGLPDEIYVDNGKDYRCRDFAGGRASVHVEYDTQRVSSLTADLGIKANFALPYNAQAKVIERRFRDHHGYFESLLEGYTGTNTVQRPEGLKRQVKSGKLLTFAQASELLDTFITTILDKLPFGSKAAFAKLSPVEIWAADNPALRRPSPASLALFCMRCSRPIKVGRAGVKDPDLKVMYWAPELAELKGKPVYLRRDLKDYSTAWVFTADDKLLCEAQLVEAVHPLAKETKSKAQLAEGMARKRREEKAVKRLIAEQATLTPEERFRLMQRGVADVNAARGYVEPETDEKVIIAQPTPLDQRAREISEYIREGTTDSPLYAVTPNPQQPKRALRVWLSDED